MDLGTLTGVYQQIAKRDEEVRQQINKELTCKGSAPLRNVRVDMHEGLAILRGSVHRYYDKQVAQELVKKIEGVETVKNEIVVL